MTIASLAISGFSLSPATAALPANCTQSGTDIQCTFDYTGAAQTWTVPAGVTSATFDLYGASGGDNSVGVPGGNGAHVQASMAVAAGDVYSVVVGQAGGDEGRDEELGASAFNGGGRGWVDGDDDNPEGTSQGGGGATDLRADPFGLEDRVLVAGGGGGAAYSGFFTNNASFSVSGGNGGQSGGAGGNGQGNLAVGGGGGGAGTQTEGGAGGTSADSVLGGTTIGGEPGGDGAFGQGGDGREGIFGSASGGGGGGYYGGGGGGGGSITSASLTVNSVAGGGGGGGGSSFVTTDATSRSVTEGANDGNGKVVITYADPDAPVKTAQTITFDPVSTGAVGGSQSLSATASSGLAVTFSVDSTSDAGVCSLAADGSTLNFLAAGTCKVNANQAGDATYEAAPQVTRSVIVSAAKTPQTITFTNPGAQNFGTTPTLTATADSGLTPTFTSSSTSVCTITSSGALTFLSTGTCTINADQAGNTMYEAAPTITRSFAVNAVVPSAPTIGTATAGDASASVTFTAPASNGGSSITGYTATSDPAGLTGTCSSSPCSVTGLTNGVAYTFTVTATNSVGAGSASGASNAVTPQASQSITFAPDTTGSVGGSQTLSAMATSGLDVAFSVDSSSDSGVCQLNGSTLSYFAVGTCVVNADQSGNSAFAPAPRVQKSVSVGVGAFATGPTTTISGLARQGQTLTADEGSPSPAPDSFEYQWLADGVAIGGATAKTFKLTSAQVGKQVTVTVTAKKAGYSDASATSAPTAKVQGIFVPGPKATISGLARVGSTLTANPGSPSPTPTTLGYRWFANGAQLPQTTRTLKLTSAHHGKRIQVRVYAIRSGYLTAASSSPATASISSLQPKTISMELNDYTVYRGQRVYAEIELLAAGEPFSIVLDGKKLVSGSANAKGIANTSFVIPSTAIRGERILRAYGKFTDRTDPDRITIR